MRRPVLPGDFRGVLRNHGLARRLLSSAMAMNRSVPLSHVDTALLERSGEVQVVGSSIDDFAFADTVLVQGAPLEVMPASHRSPPSERAPFSQRAGAPFREAWEEANQLWSATAETDRRAPVGRRLRTFFSFFEWQRDDVLRATWIALAMLVLIATVTAVALTR